jgi:uncharacterized protein (DUF952 family)
MRTIIVTTTDKFWEEAQTQGSYARSIIDSTLDEVGFIHATTPDQVVPMLNRHFSDRDDVILLLVDLNKVGPRVKFEAPLSGKAGIFPHIYGPLNIDAVYGTIRPSKDPSGNFVDSDELAKLAS